MPGTRAIGGSRAAKSVDETYRLAERAGEARARLAERDGVPPEIARTLKVTNMRDNLREGDVAAIHPATTLERQAQMHFNLRPGFWGAGSAPMGRISSPINTPQGTFTGPGHIGLHSAQINHRDNLRAVIAAGRRG